MFVRTLLVFDDLLQGAGVNYFSLDEFRARLGEHDIFGLFAVATQTDISGTLTVHIQHSGNGIRWANKNATAEINAKTITAGAETPLWASDSSGKPNLAHVRFQITLGGFTGRSHVKLYVAIRDT